MSDEQRNLHLERRDGHARCAYCHDPLPDDAGVTCDGCGTRLHAECVVEPRCPTLGCARTFVVDQPTRPSGSRRAMALFAGVLLPILCFVGLELGLLPRRDGVPQYKSDDFAWIGQFQAVDVQRLFYPLVAWSIAAYLASWTGRRGTWIRVGLRGGVLLALLFSILYLRLLGHAIVGLVIGVGLLGLGPYFALIAYARAVGRDQRSPRTDAPKSATGDDDDPAIVPWSVWSGLGVTAVTLAVLRMNERWAALPEIPHDDCFVATAAARGHPRVVGSVPVRLADGRVLLVTRQLRALKAFELALAALLPHAHRALRLVYDRVGPPVAARLGPTTATLAWVALLPAQWVAELTLRALLRDADRLIARIYARTTSTR